MRWIGRFFLIIALIFLVLDIGTEGPGPATNAAPPAADGAATGEAAAGDGSVGETATTDGSTDEAAGPKVNGPNRVMLYTLGERWYEYHPDSYLQVSPAVSRHVSPWLDDNIVQPLMLQPAFLIFFTLWLVFSLFSWLIGRSRRRDEEDW